MNFAGRLALLFSALALAGFAEAAQPARSPVSATRIALTFDDVPRQAGPFMTPDERSRRIILGLRAAGVRQAAFFVTTGNLAKPDGVHGEEHIRAYVRAGHVIANHSDAHRHLSEMTAQEFSADLDRADARLRNREGFRRWFRYPFLDEGYEDAAKRDAARAVLAARGYRNGYITVDSQDWLVQDLAAQALKNRQQIDRNELRDLYVETVVDAADGADRIARRALGRSPVHVVLLHETDLAALYIGKLVKALRSKGWTIVSADEAYADPIAAKEPATTFLRLGRVMALGDVAGIPRKELFASIGAEGDVERRFKERVLRKGRGESK
jgi:peptidoglycan-N-acetylglucosamine deacetylase